MKRKNHKTLTVLFCLIQVYLFAGDPNSSGRFSPDKFKNNVVFNNINVRVDDLDHHAWRAEILSGVAVELPGYRGDIFPAGQVQLNDCPPAPPVNTSSSQTLCANQSASLQASGSGTITWYSSPSSTIVLGTGNTFVTPTLSAGNYSYYAEAQTCSPSLSRTEITLTVHALPVISVNSGSICMGQNFTLTPAGAASYSFLSGAGIVSPTTTSEYSVVGYSSVGCISSNTAVATITVEQNPVISVNSGSICSGGTFTIIPTGAVSYTFSGGSNTVMPMSNASYSVVGSSSAGCLSNMAISSVTVAQSPVITVANSIYCAGQTPTLIGTGAVSFSFNSAQPGFNYRLVIGYSAEGCPSSPFLIQVFEVPPPVVSLSGGTICAGSSFTFNPYGAYSYTYSSGSGIVSPTTTTTYSMIGSTAEGCVSSNTAIVTVSVNPLPVVSINSGSICSGSSFSLSPSGAMSYTITGGNSVVSPTANTSYSATGTSSVGCSSTVSAVATVSVHELPAVSVSSGSICSGGSFTLSPTGAVSYTITGGNSVVSPTANTSYSITGTSSVGCSSAGPAVATVTVHELPTVSVNSGTICAGQVFTIVPSGAASYVVSGGSNTVSPASSASYSVTGTSSVGCISSNTAISNVVVLALPAVTIVGIPAICIGDSATLTATGANTYWWSNNASASNIVVSPSSNMIYSVTGTDINGCQNIAAQSLSVNPLPGVTAIASSTVVCSGSSVTLNGAGAGNYLWSDGVLDNTQFSPLVTASYTVTGTDLNGCENTASVLILVNALPVVTASASSTAICKGGSVTLNAAGANSYLWTGGITDNTPFFPDSSASYTVTGTDINGCENTASISVNVMALPDVSVSVTGIICKGESSTLTVTGASVFLWSTGNSSTSIIVSPPTTTNYTVTGTDVNGCSKSVVVTQQVEACVGLATLSLPADLEIFPNPNAGVFTIRTTSNAQVEIFNELGQIVKRVQADSEGTKVDITGLAKGIYLIVTFNATNREVLKMIVTD